MPAEQLWSADWNGDLDFDYDHAVYWPALNDMCRNKREARLARWVAAGSIIGESEDYLAGGTDESVSGFRYADDTTEANSVDGLQDKLGSVALTNEAAPSATA